MSGVGLVSGRPRRRPFPWDMVVSGITGITGDTGLLLGKLSREEPGLIAKKSPTTTDVQPTEFSYSAQNPYIEQTFVWDDWSLGFGMQNMVSLNDRRYYYCYAADASIRGLIMPGPDITYLSPATVDSTNGISHFFEIDGSLYALNGRYVLVRAEVQTITESGTPTGGTFTITYAGNTTSALAYNVSAADMQTALRLLAGFESVTVTRTGASNFVWTIVTRGAGNNPAQVTTTDSLTGGSSPATTPATSATTDALGGWTVDLDLGSGNAATDVVVTKQNGGSTTYAYIAIGDASADYIYRFDGTTYTQHASLQALAFCAVGRELFRGHNTNQVSKVDTNSDPWTAGNWAAGNSFYVGDANSAITRMAVMPNGTLLIFKTDGIYVLDEDGQDIRLYPGLGIIPDASNGKAFCNYENWTYVAYNNQFYRIDSDFSIEPIGPERSVESDQQTKGYVSACVGTPFALYAGVKNRDTGFPSLFKFGGWTLDSEGKWVKIDAWHGDISDGLGDSSSTVTALYSTTIGADSGHERMYIGRLSGKVNYFALPCTANPLNCTSYRFDADDGFDFAMPLWHGGYPADTKHIRSATISGKNITATNYPKLSVKEQGSGGSFVNYTANVSRQDLATDRTMVTGLVELNGVEDSTTVPFYIRSISIAFSVRSPVLMVWRFAVLCENGLVRRDGTPVRIGADRIRTVVQAMADTRGSCTVITPEETSAELSVTDYSEGYAWDDDAHQWRAALIVEATETAKGAETLVA